MAILGNNDILHTKLVLRLGVSKKARFTINHFFVRASGEAILGTQRYLAQKARFTIGLLQKNTFYDCNFFFAPPARRF